ncbi:MAG: hypothetical protein C6W59_04645 [Paenibacillaceae bacterium]|nr:MAG: hypothetical protein C6W59_04645 [Paenibacillaceae bacterium]
MRPPIVRRSVQRRRLPVRASAPRRPLPVSTPARGGSRRTPRRAPSRRHPASRPFPTPTSARPSRESIARAHRDRPGTDFSRG